MAQRFILGSLRAPFEALEQEVHAIERRLVNDPGDTFAVGDIVLIPVELDLTPEYIRERYAEALDGGLFDDYVVGNLCGTVHAASDTDRIQEYAGQKFIYGVGGEIITTVQDWTGEWVEPEEDPSYFAPTVQMREVPVDAEFETEGLRQWIVRTRRPLAPPPVGAKLIILVARGDYSDFEKSRMGDDLMKALGPTAARLMGVHRAAVLGVKFEGDPRKLYHRLKRAMPPNLIEDFAIFDIGLEVATMRSHLSPLHDWLWRLTNDEASDPDDLFDLPPRRQRRR